MKQLAAALAILIAAVAGISWASSRTSSAQEQDPPTDTTVPEQDSPEEDSTEPLEDLRTALDEFVECLRDQGIEVPDLEEGEGRFGFHFDFDTEDFEGLADAHGACGDALEGALPFDGGFLDREGFPFGGEIPFGGRFGGGFLGHGFGGALDLDGLAECLSDLGTFENVDEVKAQLEQCLPPFDFESRLDDLDSWLEEHGINGEEFSFGEGFGLFEGPGRFGFDFDFDFDGDPDLEEPEVEEPALEGASA